jgi:hypothetical protein
MTNLKELAQAVGLPLHNDADLTVENFTKHLFSKYTLTETVLRDDTVRRKLVGRVLGALGVKAAQTFGLTKKEIDGRELEDIFDTVKANHQKALELAAANSQVADAKVAELNQLLADKESELQTLSAKQTEMSEQYKINLSQWEAKMKAYKLNDKISKAKAAVADKLSDEFSANKLVRTGFETHFDSVYELELNEADELLVKDKATGELVKSKTNADKPATLEELYLQEAETRGVTKKNNAAPQKPVLKNKAADTAATGDVKIHPNAQKRTQLN